MSDVPVGSLWLKERFLLDRHTLTHSSYIGSNPSMEVTSKGNIDQVYGPGYRLDKDEPLHHIEFSLKYDDLNLDFMQAVMRKLPPEEVEAFIALAPQGKYSRRIGFLYEFLVDKLTIRKPVTANYEDLLEKDRYVVGRIRKNARWRINDNLLGGPAFCPMVRRKRELRELLEKSTEEEVREFRSEHTPELLSRAIRYLYRKETRSTYEIEKETAAPDRMEKFVNLLLRAGTETPEELLTESRLSELQNAIVDPRYMATGYRQGQVYVGESLPGLMESIHYIAPPPQYVHMLMAGLAETGYRMLGESPEVRAALVSFGFVFIHPFEDGNGRLHRFLIHDVLVQDGVVPQGLIIPVSAHLLNHLDEYDRILERYSRPLMQRIKYDKKGEGEIVVTNAEEVEGYFRFPDLTEHCIYLIETLRATLKEDMPAELLFIQHYDEAKRELQRIVDMPDRRLEQLMLFLHQNKGVFPKRRRNQFSELTDEEIGRMEAMYREVYEL
jgi:Fic family protein